MDTVQIVIHDCLEMALHVLLAFPSLPMFSPLYLLSQSESPEAIPVPAVLGSKPFLTVFPEHCILSAVHIIPVNNGKRQRLFRDPWKFPDYGSLK